MNIRSISVYVFLFAFFNPVAYSGDFNISIATKNKISDVFGMNKINYSKNMRIRLNYLYYTQKHLAKSKSGKTMIEGDNVEIKIAYRGQIKDIKKIGVFIDGNKSPLVSTFTLGDSVDKKLINFSVKGKADTHCNGHYKALVVIEINNELVARHVPFFTFVSDCAGQ